jgi:hypothetical protein
MIEWEDPEKAFAASGHTFPAGQYRIPLYRVAPDLRGFERIVASSNNKAVENVSAALPNLEAIASDATPLRDFQPLADTRHRAKTWGVVAAVLGKAKNCHHFKEVFWWDDTYGMNNYLSCVAGLTRHRGKGHAAGLLEAERPPMSKEEALQHWKQAREEVRRVLKASCDAQQRLGKLRATLAQLSDLAQRVAEAKAKYDDASTTVKRLEEELERVRQAEVDAMSQLQLADQELDRHRLEKPKRWARVCAPREAHNWSARFAELRTQRDHLACQHRKITEKFRWVKTALHQARQKHEEACTVWQHAHARYQQALESLDEAQQSGVTLVDVDFFRLPHTRRHQQSPWWSLDDQRQRDQVFLAAIAVHLAYIDAAAMP